jgi:hypothetical protein
MPVRRYPNEADKMKQPHEALETLRAPSGLMFDNKVEDS